eukprot:Opistho-2@51529
MRSILAVFAAVVMAAASVQGLADAAGAPYDYCGAPLPGALDAPAGMRLASVQVVTRHGDRVPCNPFADDKTEWDCPMTSAEVPSIFDGDANDAVGGDDRGVLFAKTYTEGQSWRGSCMLCQLTKRGALQHRELGRALRRRYDATGVIPQSVDSDALFVRATDTWRTQQSAQSHILGLFEGTRDDANNGMHRKRRSTLPIYTRQYATDEMVPNDALCPRLGAWEKEIYVADEYISFLAKFKVLVDRMAPAFNVSGPTVNPTTVKDNAWGKWCNGMDFPVDPADYALMTAYANWDSNYSNPLGMSRLAMQPFMQTLLAQMDAHVAGGAAARYSVYSGHDSTLAPLISALQIGGNWPPYASHAI